MSSGDWRSKSKKVDAVTAAVPSDWRAKARPVIDQGPEALSPSSMSGTLLRHGAQGASLGFLDELSGVVNGGAVGSVRAIVNAMKTDGGRALMRRMDSRLQGLPDIAVDAMLEQALQDTGNAAGMDYVPGGALEAAKGGYVAGRDDSRRELAQGEVANPKAALAAQMAGGLLVPVPGAGGGAGKTLLGGAVKMSPRTWQLAKTGAMLGGANALGNSEADLVDGPHAEQVGGKGRAAFDTAVGATAGALMGPVLDKGLQKAVPVVRRWAQENFARAGGLAPGISNRAQQAGLETADEVRRWGQQLKDMDLVGPLSTPEDVGKAGLALRPVVGQRIENVLADADASGAQPRAAMISRAMRDAVAGAGASLPELDQAAGALKFADMVEKEGVERAGTFKSIGKLKSDLYKLIGKAYTNPDGSMRSDLQMKAVSQLRKGLEDEVERGVGPQLADEFRTANSRWGALETLKKLAQNEETRDVAKNKAGNLLKAMTKPGGAAAAGAAAGAAGGGLPGAALGALVGGLGAAAAPRLPAFIGNVQYAAGPKLPQLASPAVRLLTPELARYLSADDPTYEEQVAALAQALRRR